MNAQFDCAEGLRIHLIVGEAANCRIVLRSIDRSRDQLLEPIIRGSLSRRKQTVSETILELLELQEPIGGPLLRIVEEGDYDWNSTAPVIDGRNVWHYAIRLTDRQFSVFEEGRSGLHVMRTAAMEQCIYRIVDDASVEAGRKVMHKSDFDAVHFLLG